MLSYSETSVFSRSTIEVYKAACLLAEWLPEPEPGKVVWRCHEVARAIGRSLGFRIVDGWFGAVDHSWIVVANDAHSVAILDVYSVGSLPQVQLHDGTSPALPQRYHVGPERTDIRENDVEFLIHALKTRHIVHYWGEGNTNLCGATFDTKGQSRTDIMGKATCPDCAPTKNRRKK